jgi:putative NADH-flavin reductase
MKLTIFAATGGIGRRLLDQALTAGHDVTAVVRNPASLPTEVRAVTADLTDADPATLESAVAGADAVLSGLGPRAPRSKSDIGITSHGTRAIINAMEATDARRFVMVSAAPVGTFASPGNPNPPKHDPGDGFVMRHLGARIARSLFGAHYVDLALTEELIRDSGLDWTITRPPRLTDGALTGTYRLADGQNVRRGVLISRADVAHYMLRTLDEPETIRHTIGLAY